MGTVPMVVTRHVGLVARNIWGKIPPHNYFTVQVGMGMVNPCIQHSDNYLLRTSGLFPARKGVDLLQAPLKVKIGIIRGFGKRFCRNFCQVVWFHNIDLPVLEQFPAGCDKIKTGIVGDPVPAQFQFLITLDILPAYSLEDPAGVGAGLQPDQQLAADGVNPFPYVERRLRREYIYRPYFVYRFSPPTAAGKATAQDKEKE